MKTKGKKTLATILSALSGLITKRTYSVSGIAFSTYYGTVSKDVTLAGYTPIGIPRVSINQAVLHCYLWQVVGNTAVFGVSRGTASGTISSLSITFDVVYVRTSLVA